MKKYERRKRKKEKTFWNEINSKYKITISWVQAFAKSIDIYETIYVFFRGVIWIKLIQFILGKKPKKKLSIKE